MEQDINQLSNIPGEIEQSNSSLQNNETPQNKTGIMQKITRTMARPVVYGVLLIVSIMVNLGYIFRGFESLGNSGLAGIALGVYVLYGYIVIAGITIVANLIILFVFEKVIKNKKCKFKKIKTIYPFVLIIILIIILFVPRIMSDFEESTRRNRDLRISSDYVNLDKIMSNQNNIDQAYNICIKYLKTHKELLPKDNMSLEQNCRAKTSQIKADMAIKKNDASLCVNDDVCFYVYALNTKDYAICNKIEGSGNLSNFVIIKINGEGFYSKRQCFKQIARDLQDIKICNEIKLLTPQDRDNLYYCVSLIIQGISGPYSKDAKTRDVSYYCDQIIDISAKEQCNQMAIGSITKIEDCSTFGSLSVRNSCIMQLATNLEDCNLVLNADNKNLCIEKLSTKIEYCNLIKDSLSRDNCIDVVAVNSKNKELCGSISSENLKGGCLIELMTNVNECNIFVEPNMKNFCVIRLSKMPKDCNLMIELPTTTPKDLCILELVKRLNNKEWCNLMSSEYYKSDCFEYFEYIK